MKAYHLAEIRAPPAPATRIIQKQKSRLNERKVGIKMTKVEIIDYLNSKEVSFRLVMTEEGEKFCVMFGNLEYTFSSKEFKNEEEVYETIVYPWKITHDETLKNRLTEQIQDFENVKKKLRIRLIHNIPEDMLCRKHYDFYEEVYVEVGVLSIRLKKAMLDIYEVSEAEIFEIAEKNTQLLPQIYLNVKEQIEQGSDLNLPKGPEMYAFKYDEKAYGAAILMNANALAFMSQKLKGDFYIIPSSIHEIILFTLNGEEEKGFIEKMKQDVEEVNTLMVEEQEILSYHVFKFSAEKKELICF